MREAPCTGTSRGCYGESSGGEQTGQQGDQGKADERDTAAGHKLFYPQLGVKLCSMAGGGVALIGITLIPLLSGLLSTT